MQKVISDLSLCTGIDIKYLNKLVQNLELVISNNVFNEFKNEKHIVELDIGIGILYIKINEDCINYKFIPSKKLETTIISEIKDPNKSPIIVNAEKQLKNKIENLYMELL